MLIDLKWTTQYAPRREHTEYYKEFNTEGGSLVVVCEFPPQKDLPRIFRRQIAKRINKGVYWARSLSNDIETFTEWNVVNSFMEPCDLMQKMMNTKDQEELERLRIQYRRICMVSEFGNADTFKQIFKYGHKFVGSPDPYVLEVRTADVSGPDGDRYLHKNGGYMGKKKVMDLKEVIHFSFHKLIKKEGI